MTSACQPIFDVIDAGHYEYTVNLADVKASRNTRGEVGLVLCRICGLPMPCSPLLAARRACPPPAASAPRVPSSSMFKLASS
jgi:hypothetical protein